MAYTYTKQRDKFVKKVAEEQKVPIEKVIEIVREVEENTVVVPTKPKDEPETTPIKEVEVDVADSTRDEMAHEHVHASDPAFVESESEIGMSEAWAVNNKHMFDAFLQRDLQGVDDSRAVAHRANQNALTTDQQLQAALLNHINTMNQMTAQLMQNAIETANMSGKQALRHAEIAIDHQWNLEPSQGASEATVLRSVTIDDASLKAIGGMVAAAMADAVTRMGRPPVVNVND